MGQETLQTALNRAPAVRAIAQLERSLNQSVRVTHVAQLSAILHRKPAPHGSTGLDRAAVVQRAFEPVTVTGKSHLRASHGGNVAGGQRVGRAIPAGTEIVADSASQQVQHRSILRDVDWTPAVDVTAAAWNPAAHPAAHGFIRSTKIVPRVYPRSVTVTLGSRGQLPRQARWDERVGEYTTIEPSLETPADEIVLVGGQFRRLDGAFNLHPLTTLEQSQVDDISREAAAELRLRDILVKAATAGGIDPALVATPENVEGLEHPLRMEVALGSQADMDKWYAWVQAVFLKIEAGANELVASINHWRGQLSPADITQCQVTRIEFKGSDLHDKGLGAVVVDFTKPLGGAIFAAQTNVTAVLKPEDRNIERALFGKQAGSLAAQVNLLAGLNPADEITRIEMETHATYGSIIEFVRAEAARKVNGAGADTQAMSEGIAFAFLAGLSDVHQDNVLWDTQGNPYFIDADNALNAARLQTPTSQSGFSMYNPGRTQTDIDALQRNLAASRSRIVQALRLNSTPLLAAVQAAFTNTVGRLVPMYTNHWANRLKFDGYITADAGTPADGIGADQTFSRWGLANKSAAKLPDGVADRAGGPGLVTESGVAATGRHYNPAVEAAQIKADLDQGKIPFYNYDYTSGHVTHNGQVVWHGQTLADAVAILRAKFPPPPPVIPAVAPPVGTDDDTE